jgi:hypothetical protein
VQFFYRATRYFTGHCDKCLTMGEAAVSTGGGLWSFQIFEYSEMSVATVVSRNTTHKCSAAQSAVSGRSLYGMSKHNAIATAGRLPGAVFFGKLGAEIAPAERLRCRPFRAISERLGSLRLAAQDVALSRRKRGFESPRERQGFQQPIEFPNSFPSLGKPPRSGVPFHV